MSKALKNQSGASFLLLVVVMSSVMLVTLLSIGYNMYQWNLNTSQYQRRLDSMIALESLAIEVKEAFATAQAATLAGTPCQNTRDLRPAAPSPRMNTMPDAAGIDFDIDNNGNINGANETGVNSRFCFPDRLCIPHPNPGSSVGANTNSLICYNPGGANLFDPGNLMQRLNLKDSYVMNFQIEPPTDSWGRFKFEAVAYTEKLFYKSQSFVKKMSNTAIAQLLVARPINAVADFTPLNRQRPGNPGGINATNPLGHNCDINSGNTAGIANYGEPNTPGLQPGPENLVCKSCAAGGNLACITLQVCLHPRNCGNLANTSDAANQGWYKQVVGIKLNQ